MTHDRDAVQGTEIQTNDRPTRIYNAYPPKWVTPTIQLSVYREEDREDLVRYLNMPEIYSYLSGPPFPYTLEHSNEWIQSGHQRLSRNGTPLDMCLRDMAKGGVLIGRVRVSDASDEDLSGDDLGYWLSPEYKGQGIITKAAKLMLQDVSIKELGKRKFNAHAFHGNWASRRVLEKVGFVYQPDREASVVKNGQTIQMWVFRMYLSEEDVARREVVEQAIPLPLLVK